MPILLSKSAYANAAKRADVTPLFLQLLQFIQGMREMCLFLVYCLSHFMYKVQRHIQVLNFNIACVLIQYK